MLALHKPFTLNKSLVFAVHIESAVRNLSSLNFLPLTSVFVIGNPRIIPLNYLCFSISFMVNVGIPTKVLDHSISSEFC